jgi:hypothetical protein
MTQQEWINTIRLVSKVANKVSDGESNKLTISEVKEIQTRINSWYRKEISEDIILVVLKGYSHYVVNYE